MIARLLLAGFLIAHGAIHTGFISPRPPVTAGGPAWPFELGRSWVLGTLGIEPETARILGIALVAVTLAGFALAALAALGLAPASIWPAAVAVGAIASIALLAVFFHPWLVIGFAIDAALLWLVLVHDWAPDGLAS
jgi:hypothetical protein